MTNGGGPERCDFVEEKSEFLIIITTSEDSRKTIETLSAFLIDHHYDTQTAFYTVVVGIERGPQDSVQVPASFQRTNGLPRARG
jgi:hypothetical protein